MSEDDKEKDRSGYAFGCVVIWVILLVIALKAVVLQWLLGLFGWRFDYLTSVGILLAIDFVFGAVFGKGKGK